MIHAICDFCGKDCHSAGAFIQMTAFHNFARYRDSKSIFGKQEKTKNYVICSNCIKEKGLPDPFKDFREIDTQELSYEKTYKSITKKGE
jgi:hypothetical protein